LTRRDFSLALGSALAGGVVLRGQEVDPGSTIHVDVDLVNFVFTVRKGKDGQLVSNLTKDDFLVFEDGKPQTIANFARESNLPYEMGMLIDVSKSQTNLIETERQAGYTFFSSAVRPHDEAFLLAFGKDTTLVQDFTGSVPKLKAALDSIKADPMPTSGRGGGGNGNGGGGNGNGGGGGRGGGGMGWPGGGTGWPGGGGGMGGRRGGGRGGNPQPNSTSQQNHKGTLMFDALYLACTDELAHKEGRKALLLITDGEDRGSYYSRGQAIEAAQRVNAIVYSIYYVDPKVYKQRGGSQDMTGPDDLQKLSDQTGGRVFKVTKDHTLEDVYTELQAELRSQYSLGYKSTNPDRNGEFREVEIRAKTAGYDVQTRKGYFATRVREST
jgi:VWFA-related protein